MSQPHTHPQPITITVDQHGNFTYNPAVRRAKRGEEVKWTCSSGNFVVFFPDGTPFDGYLEVHGTKDGPPVGHSVRDTDNAYGVYHYTVAVATPSGPLYPGPGSGHVFLNAGCPEIIVER